jgi:hypothetical protein
MNKKLKKQLISFKNSVGFYIKQEYRPKYSRYYKDYCVSIKHIVESYYLGGNSVPETAGAVVSYVKKYLC